MIVTLDGQRLSQTFNVEDALQSLVDRVRQEHLGERLVVELAVDGTTLLEAALMERLRQPIGTAAQIDLTSADRRQLAADALREAANQMEIAIEAHREIADEIAAGHASGAVRDYAQIVAIWHGLRASIENAGPVLGYDLANVQVTDRPVSARFSELAARLRDVRDAFDARDWVLLSDLMRYEMPDLCTTWRDICTELAGSIETGTASA